jgi:hypothetical protein
MTSLQISDNFCWNSDKKTDFFTHTIVSTKWKEFLFYEYLYEIIIKWNHTMTKAIIQQFTVWKLKHFSWSYMDNFDICSLGFSCALSVAHILNSLNNI